MAEEEQIRKEYVDNLRKLEQLVRMREQLLQKLEPSSHDRVEKIQHKQLVLDVEQLIDDCVEPCSRRYIFYKIFNIPILPQVEKLLKPQTTAQFTGAIDSYLGHTAALDKAQLFKLATG